MRKLIDDYFDGRIWTFVTFLLLILFVFALIATGILVKLKLMGNIHWTWFLVITTPVLIWTGLMFLALMFTPLD